MADSGFTPGGLRLMVFDATCLGKVKAGGLSRIWRAGGEAYRALGRFDRVLGARDWREALGWLATTGSPHLIAEIQFWGHGKWGAPRIGSGVLDRRSLLPGHQLNILLRAIRDRLRPDGEALFWFRTCETFGAIRGHDFARAFTDLLGCRAAGHTHIISFLQSGTHSIRPGFAPSWPVDEGIRRGTPESPLQAYPSVPGAPNTITCLSGRIPAAY